MDFFLKTEKLSDGSVAWNVDVWETGGMHKVETIKFIDEDAARNFLKVLNYGALNCGVYDENGEEL